MVPVEPITKSKRTRPMILVALGANLPGPAGTPRRSCELALAVLASLPDFRLAAASRWYGSAPFPPSAVPAAGRYVNGVALLARRDGAFPTPEDLLARLHRIEWAFGRRRSVPNAPRPLDLDLVAFDDVRRAFPDPVLPHPRAHLRRFVLAPLAEIAPEWRHPVSGRTASALLRALPDDDTAPLAASHGPD